MCFGMSKSSGYQIPKSKTKYSELNDRRHSQSSVCCSVRLLVSFPIMWTLPQFFQEYLSCHLLKHKAAVPFDHTVLVCVCVCVFYMILTTKATVSLTHCVAAAAFYNTRTDVFNVFKMNLTLQRIKLVSLFSQLISSCVCLC